MNTVLVWVLVTFGGSSSSALVYSPPMPDKAMCEQLQKSIVETRNQFYMRCVQIRMVVIK
jgi:hypothetical protein